MLLHDSVDFLWGLGPIHKVVLIHAVWIDQVDDNTECKYLVKKLKFSPKLANIWVAFRIQSDARIRDLFCSHFSGKGPLGPFLNFFKS